MPIDPRVRGECGALRLIYTERQLRMRVYAEKRKTPSGGARDMRRHKYGSANFKYVKVEREGSGRVVTKNATRSQREMVSKVPRVLSLALTMREKND